MFLNLQTFLASLPFFGLHSEKAEDLPVVDLGYVRQQATTYRNATRIYTFSNIRYARPPVGDLRWAPPQAPEPDPTLQRGESDRMCFQAQPFWQFSSLGPWIGAWLSNNTASFFETFPEPPALPPIPPNLSDLFPALLPAETEDCLFLDVHVLREVFERREDRNRNGSAIFVWVHGGGLMLGNKNAESGFEGIVAKSRQDSQEPVIVVSINYRLGAFGFLGGPSLKAAGGVSNAGLLDQEFAFKWVQKYAHLFGGDPHRVTVVGESAGGASIVHHITARGGRGEAPAFQRAIVQSAGWNPTGDSSHLETTYQAFLKALKVRSLQEARCLPSIEIRNANFLLTFTLRWGELGFGVETDGDYVPEPPARLLSQGKFHHNISVMAGQNAAEGVLFTSPWVQDAESTFVFISDSLPTASAAAKSYIADSLYPATFDGSQPYRSYLERTQFIVSEAGVYCNSDFLARAISPTPAKMFNYLFSVPPALHGDDLAYTFYDGQDPVVNKDLATQFQRYLLNFVREGDPNGSELRWFEEYGDTAWTMELAQDGFGETVNPGANGRCRWWQGKLYD